MFQTGFRAAAPLLLSTLAVLTVAGSAFVSPLAAQQAVERRPVQAPPTTDRPSVIPNVDAEGTRQELMDILGKHPPSVGRVLKLDPSLIRNETYLASYPALGQFLAQHPEIPQNSAFYFGQIYIAEGDRQALNPRMRMLEDLLNGLGGLLMFVIAVVTLIWLVKAIVDQRRWTRLSKIQAEVHSKLMDRFSNNDELMTYVQTPSGRRFLESGPSPLEEGPRSIGAPFARILWSVQIGVVLLVAGLGLLYVSTKTFEEVREFFFICGTLCVALGAGFTVSAAAAYLLSRKLGLFEPPTTVDHA
jgi:hypothetical protein